MKKYSVKKLKIPSTGRDIKLLVFQHCGKNAAGYPRYLAAADKYTTEQR